MNTSSLRAAFVVAAVTFALVGNAEAVPICNGSGPCYDTNANLGLSNNTWPGAQVAATTVSFNGQPGHLATITSAAEQTFINANFLAFINTGPYFGLSQSPAGAEPGNPGQGASGGWQWVTGEPFYSGATNTAADVIFHNWNSGEPNEGLGGFSEDFAHFFNGANGTWNDRPGDVADPFLVEFEPAATPAIPEPRPWLLVSLGLAGVCGWTRRRKS